MAMESDELSVTLNEVSESQEAGWPAAHKLDTSAFGEDHCNLFERGERVAAVLATRRPRAHFLVEFKAPEQAIEPLGVSGTQRLAF
jgi:hypothetical protein